MKTILIIRLGRLGDVVLTGPFVKNLRFLYPEARMVFVTRAAYQPLVRLLPGVTDTVAFPDDGGYLDLVRLSSQLDEYQADLVVDLHKNFRSFHLANLSKARYKIVYRKRRKERQAAVNEKKFVNPIPHTTDLYNAVISQLKGEPLARRPDIGLSPDSLIGKANGRSGVVLAPGAGAMVKAWPTDRFAELAERLAGDFGRSIHIFLGDKEAELERFFEHLPADKKTIHYSVSIPDIAAVLAKSELSVTNDSGLMHISSAVGTPTIALFGPTHEQLGFYPLGIHDQMLAVDEKCRPCSLHGDRPCYREEQYCLTRMMTGAVYEKAAGILEKPLRPAVFIDRDGTLIVDRHYLADPDKVEFLPGALDAVRGLKKSGYAVVIISNQSGVARGFFTVEAVEAVHRRLVEKMAAAGCRPDDVQYCPYHPDGDVAEYTREHECRKPRAGMLEASARALGLDLKRSFMIGDKLTDITCGQVGGALPILVRTGYGAETEREYPPEPYPRPYQVCDDLASAARLIMARK